MDGKDRWLDNMYVERFWRSLKQEEVYRRAYDAVSEARKGVADYLRYFNEERPRQGLDNRTPDGRILQTKAADQGGVTHRSPAPETTRTNCPNFPNHFSGHMLLLK